MKELIIIAVVTLVLAIFLARKFRKNGSTNTVTILVTCSPALNKDHPEFAGTLEMTLLKNGKEKESVNDEVLVTVEIPPGFPNQPIKADVYPGKKIDYNSFTKKLPTGGTAKIYNCKGTITKI